MELVAAGSLAAGSSPSSSLSLDMTNVVPLARPAPMRPASSRHRLHPTHRSRHCFVLRAGKACSPDSTGKEEDTRRQAHQKPLLAMMISFPSPPPTSTPHHHIMDADSPITTSDRERKPFSPSTTSGQCPFPILPAVFLMRDVAMSRQHCGNATSSPPAHAVPSPSSTHKVARTLPSSPSPPPYS